MINGTETPTPNLIAGKGNYIPAQKVTNPMRGSLQGWTDPIGVSLTPLDLIGLPTSPGIYQRMRQSHATINQIMEARKNFLNSVEFIFTGRHADKLNKYWNRRVRTINNLPYSLSSFIADVSDGKSSYGFKVYEYHKDDYSTYLYPVAPENIMYFEGTDTLTGVMFRSGNGSLQLPASNVQLFSNMTKPGNWWGVADLRSLVDAYLVYESEVKNFLSSRPIEKGIVWASQEQGSTIQASDELVEGLGAIQRGQTVSMILDPGYKLNVLQYNNGQDSVNQLQTIINKTDEIFRGALWSSLESLGISSTGSRALGETFAINDQKKFEQYLEAELETLKVSQLFADIAYDLAIPITEIEISTPGLMRSDDRTQYDKVLAMLEKGTLQRSDISTEDWTRIMQSIGLSPVTVTPSSSVNKFPVEVNMSEDPYGGIDFTPPQAVRDNAAKALFIRSEKAPSERGMTDIGIARARDLSNGRAMSPDTIRRMLSYFQRHEVDKQGSTWDEQGKGWQAWYGWGGDEGYAWVTRLVERMDRMDDTDTMSDTMLSERSNVSSTITRSMIKGLQGYEKALKRSTTSSLDPSTISAVKRIISQGTCNQETYDNMSKAWQGNKKLLMRQNGDADYWMLQLLGGIDGFNYFT